MKYLYRLRRTWWRWSYRLSLALARLDTWLQGYLPIACGRCGRWTIRKYIEWWQTTMGHTAPVCPACRRDMGER